MLERWLFTARTLWRSIAVGSIGCTVIASAAGWLMFVDVTLPARESTRELRSFAAEVRRRAPQPQMVLLFRTEAHALAYHLGKPSDRLMEWENLDIWACQPTPVHVIMPAEYAQQWPQFLEAGRLYRVTSTDMLAGGPHEEPLVLFSTQPSE
jgi:hypothetical protein